MTSPGRPAGPPRSMMFGGVRTAIHTLAAPPVARSWAISMPDEPEPTTSTRFPAYGTGFRYSEECSSSPVNSPGQSGRDGVCIIPVATTAWRASTSPLEVCSRHPPARCSRRFTVVFSLSAMPDPWACRSKWSITWSRVGNVGVPLGYGRPGRCENCLPVLSFSRSYRVRQDDATSPARSMRSGRTPRSCGLIAVAIPAGPAPMTTA
jgi:hypothetical protein